ncbi:MAG: hypothetical protein ACPGVD_05120 [Flavobacteriales bacterium]
MKMLLYTNTGLSSKQIGLTAQYVSDCIEKNYELKIVQCDNVMNNCSFNHLHNTLACASCQSRSTTLYKQGGIKDSDLISLEKISFDVNIPNFKELNELVDFSFEGVNIGRGVASSIITYYRDYKITSEGYGGIIELEITKAINVYLNFKKLLSENNYDHVVIFNGRFAETHPILEYCKLINQDFLVIEAGALNNYEIYENCLPHSIKFRTKVTWEIWEAEKDEAYKKEVGHEWFRKKRYRDETIERSFTKEQGYGDLPSNFDPNRCNVLFLNSSEDELKVIHEWQHNMFKTQNEAIVKIANHFEGNDDFHFYLRVHPNLGKVKNIQIEEIRKMNYPNLTIIQPDSPIDTYGMMDACEKTIVFGSTSGIEATYWGNASILMGKAYYYLLKDSCYKPKSFDELYDLIEDRDLKPMPQEACLPYGFYYTNVGKASSSFENQGLNNSYFKGKKIKKWYPSTFVFFFKYLKDLKKWKFAYKSALGKRLPLSDFFRYKI